MEPVLDKVRQLVLAGLGTAPARVWLFGSWARGEQKRSSDIDIAIDHDGDVTPRMIAHIRDILEESTVPYRVDVVDLRLAGEALVNRVRQEGILWRE